MDPGLVTPNTFQQRVEERLRAALKELGVQVDSRRVGWEVIESLPREPPEAFVYIKAQELEVAIREGSVSYTITGKGDYYEIPDYANADALADALLSAVTARWRRPQRE